MAWLLHVGGKHLAMSVAQSIARRRATAGLSHVPTPEYEFVVMRLPTSVAKALRERVSDLSGLVAAATGTGTTKPSSRDEGAQSEALARLCEDLAMNFVQDVCSPVSDAWAALNDGLDETNTPESP
jgi:hypothetical protein